MSQFKRNMNQGAEKTRKVSVAHSSKCLRLGTPVPDSRNIAQRIELNVSLDPQLNRSHPGINAINKSQKN